MFEATQRELFSEKEDIKREILKGKKHINPLRILFGMKNLSTIYLKFLFSHKNIS